MIVFVLSKIDVVFKLFNLDVKCKGVFFFLFFEFIVVLCLIRILMIKICLFFREICKGVWFFLFGMLIFVLFFIKVKRIFLLKCVVRNVGVWSRLLCLLMFFLFFNNIFVVVRLLIFVVKCNGVLLLEFGKLVFVLCDKRKFVILSCWFLIVLCKGEFFWRLYWLILILIMVVSKLFVILVLLYIL